MIITHLSSHYWTAGLCGLSRTSAGDGSVPQNIMAVGGARTSISPPLTSSIFGNHGNISPGYFEGEHEKRDADEVTAEPRLCLSKLLYFVNGIRLQVWLLSML